MNYEFKKSLALALSLTLATDCALGANQATTAVDRSWTTVMKWPDLSQGMWQMNRGGGGPSAAAGAARQDAPQTVPPNGVPGGARPSAPPGPGGGGGISLSAGARAKAANSAEEQAIRQGFTPCTPFSPFDMLSAGHPLKFFYTQGEILIMSDGDNLAVRRVFMDGGMHDDIDPSYAGRSFGHWDGKTLVIETSGFDEMARLSGGVVASPQTHLSERYKLIDANTMELTAVVTDPELLTKPWEMKFTYYRRTNWDLQITTCIGTNREEPSASGKYKLNLTPPQ